MVIFMIAGTRDISHVNCVCHRLALAFFSIAHHFFGYDIVYL